MEFASNPHILASVESTWASVLGIKAVLAQNVAGTPSPNFMTAIIHISGEWRGAIVMSFDQVSANSVASGMYSMPAEEIPAEDMTDAIGEISNFVGGSLKMALAGMNNLSLPSVIYGNHHEAFIHSSKHINSTLFEAEGSFFKVSVFEEKERDL